jgi:hypothetical protein
MIWLAGKERFVSPRARIGFHASKDARDNTVSATGNAVMGAYYYEMGITNMTTIARLVTSPPNEMFWVKFDDLARLKIDAKLLRGDLAMRTTRR